LRIACRDIIRIDIDKDDKTMTTVRARRDTTRYANDTHRPTVWIDGWKLEPKTVP